MVANIVNENYRWIFFVVPLIITLFYFPNVVLLDFTISFTVYCLCGGWRFMRIVVLTGPRDFCGVKVLISVKFLLWKMKRKGLTVPDLFEQTVERYTLKTAFMFEGNVWSFIDIDEYSNKMANYLLRLGVKPGDIVGLFMESRPVYVAVWIGISKIGAVPALLNTNLRNDALVHCINNANVCGVICGTELCTALINVSQRISNENCFKLFLEGNLSAPTNGIIRNTAQDNLACDKLVDSQSIRRPPAVRNFTRKVTDPLMYIYTSGTTGLPKAAKISHSRFVMMSYGTAKMLSIGQSDVIYNPLPLYHSAGGILGVGQVLIGGSTMALRRKFSASNFWSDCIKYQATVVQYIGEICRYLLAQPEKIEETLHQVRLAFGNGIRPQIWCEFQKRFHVARIGEFYGATESNANIINNVNKIGSVGFGTRIVPSLYPITLIQIDRITNEPLRDRNGLCIQCKPGEVGELVGKIHDNDPMRQFDGYVNSMATNKKIVCDVFNKGDRAFLTGDLLMQDELGFFFFKDRLGDTFRWKGENVSTAEVEAVLSNCLDQNDCVVYGVEIPNNEGRVGMAAIVDTEKKIENFDKLVDKIQEALPAYSRPIFIRLCQNIEITGTFKLKKLDLINEGFDPSATCDEIFYFNNKSNNYVRLTTDVHEQIITGSVRF